VQPVNAPSTALATQLPLLKVSVKYSATGSNFAPVCEGLVLLRRDKKLCDMTVVANAGVRFKAHRAVLGAHSDLLASKLEEPGAEIQVDYASYEAVDLFVRWAYSEVNVQNYHPSSTKVNEEVLQISSDLQIPMLSELCALWLSTDVVTGNVVDRIRLCEEFGMPKLRAALVAGIVKDTRVLQAVSQNPATLKHPALMRELLSAIAFQADA